MGEAGDPRDDWSQDAPTVLVFTDSAAAGEWIARTVESCGGRLLATLPIAGAAARIAHQAAVDAVLADVADDAGEALDALFAGIAAGVAAGRFAALVSVSAALIDPAAAALGDAVTLLAAPGVLEKMAEIALLLEGQRQQAASGAAHQLADATSDAVRPRLQQLSEEVGRIARQLALLSQGDPGRDPVAAAAPPIEGAGAAPDEPIEAQTVRTIIRIRRLRDHYFSPQLFADPAWDMLLDLIAARIERRRVAVSSLCIAAAVPPTTALRWVKTLTEQGVLVRVDDPNDGRRVFIELSEQSADAMMRYLAMAQRVATLPI